MLYPNFLVRMYKVYIEPIITYGLLIYGSASKADLQKFHSHQKRAFRGMFNKREFDCFSSTLDEYFVLMPHELSVMELSEFLKRCSNGFSPNSSIGIRWRQAMPKTFHKKERLLPICRNRSGSRSLIYRACKLYNVLKKIDHPIRGLPLPHPKFFNSDINCLELFVFRNQKLLHNICN